MLKMKNELYFYDIFPKVIPVGKETSITIKPLSLHTRLTEDEYCIKVFPINVDVNSKTKPSIKEYKTRVIDGKLVFSYLFEEEQEYSVRIYPLVCDEKTRNIANLSVYALEKDLFERKPLIGDFHVHSCFSDGREGPDFVAAMYRRAGYDFTAITDHRQYDPSNYAINSYKGVDLDFKIFNGEEIHTPDNHVHLVNFGSDASVNKCFYDPANGEDGENKNAKLKATWLKEVAELQATLPKELPNGIDPFVHASCMLAIKKVREANGMCILAHPHWLADVRNVSDCFTKYYLENGFADAFELIGGQTWHENMTQIALYQELRSTGAKIPIVGSSDSHGTVNPKHTFGLDTNSYFTEEKTMVFALENTKTDIISAVKGLYSVAVDHYIDQDFHINGPYRLVQYALFLQENYFPLHDELCYEEGRLMRMYINGSEEAKARLSNLKGQTEQLFNKYFSR